MNEREREERGVKYGRLEQVRDGEGERVRGRRKRRCGHT